MWRRSPGIGFTSCRDYLVTASRDSTIRFWDPASNRMVGVLDGDPSEGLGPGEVYSLGLSSTGILAVSRADRKVKVWQCLASRKPDVVESRAAEKRKVEGAAQTEARVRTGWWSFL